MKKLGTHNSLSCLPCQWYLRPFAWVGKCQSLDIAEQYKKGVRWFDIRIKYVNDRTISGHGLLTYKVDMESVFAWFNQHIDCIVRLYLENSKNNPEKHFDRFAKDIKVWRNKYKNIRFVEGGCRFQYRQFIEDNVFARHCYWSKGDTLIPYPRGWAEENNHRFHGGDNEDIFSVYDFIEY